jgi:predicted Holliday junction resolvase-like endonuclease
MFVLTIIATLVAAVSVVVSLLSVVHARRSADAAESSVAEAKRSADAAERAAHAAMITAKADTAEDHRKREPQLQVTVEKAEHNATDAIYRVLNQSAVDRAEHPRPGVLTLRFPPRDCSLPLDAAK